MPVKLSDIKGVVLEKKLDFGMVNQTAYNEALSLQSEVCIGINREKLVKAIVAGRTKHRTMYKYTKNPNKYEKEIIADFIIAAESTLLEVKK